MDTIHYTQNLNDSQRLMFQTHIDLNRKDATVAVLLAFVLGSFGAHRFYLRQIGWGVIYLLLCWTFIPGLIAIVECFFLPGRVRRYNNVMMDAAYHRIRNLPHSTVEAV